MVFVMWAVLLSSYYFKQMYYRQWDVFSQLYGFGITDLLCIFDILLCAAPRNSQYTLYWRDMIPDLRRQ